MSGARRILISPRPGFSGGPAIALLRIERALREKGYGTTSLPFRIFGYSLLHWDFALLMGVPAHAHRVLGGKRPVIVVMGKPEDPVESAAVGRVFSEQDRLDNEVRAETICRAHFVAFISNYVASVWRRWFELRGREFPSSDKWGVVYHGLDLEQFSPKPGFLAGGLFTIGCVGAVRTPMRVDAICEVSRRLSFPHRFVLVGSVTAECEERLRYQRAAGWDAELVRVPWLPADRLPEVLRTFHCLLHPVDYEGFGIVVAEAMACGVPAVVTCHGATGEIVGDGGAVVSTTQYAYNDDFYSALASGVEHVRAHHGNYVLSARAAAVGRFDISRITQQYIDIAASLGVSV